MSALRASLCAAVLLVPGLARGLPMASSPPEPTAGDAKPKILEEVGITERLGEKIPGDLSFTGADGRSVRLADRLGTGKPIVLTLVYYDCPMLCGMLLSGLTRGLRASGLELGRDYDALTLSFNPREAPALAAQKQGHFLQALGRPEKRADWPFLVGPDPAIRSLAGSLGFHYAYDSRAAQYAHTAAAFVLTPDGRVSRYFYGVEFNPKDLRLAVLEAGGGRIGSTLERVLLTCYRWDPASRRYAFFINAYFKAGGLLVFVGLATLILTLLRRERAKAVGG